MQQPEEVSSGRPGCDGQVAYILPLNDLKADLRLALCNI